MELSLNGLGFLVGWEGFKSKASKDQGGKLDIGYGHLLTQTELDTGEIQLPDRSITWTDGITEREGRDIMRADIAESEKLVGRATAGMTLEQHEFDALAIFAYNVGSHAFRTSTMLRRLLMGNIEGAMEAWSWFDKVTIRGQKTVSRGLQKRRRAEINLFENADYSGRP